MWRLIAVFSLLLLFSCKKDSVSVPFVGKWRMVDAYSGPACGCWYQVSPISADTLEFTVTGEYKIITQYFSSYLACPGRYRFTNDSTIGLTSDCAGPNPSPELIGIYSQSTKLLTIEYDVQSYGRKERYIKL